MLPSFSRIAVFGAGKVGTALSSQLRNKGREIVFVSNKTLHSTRKSAKQLHSRNQSIHFSDIPPDTNLIIIAAPSQAIPKIVQELTRKRSMRYHNVFIVHTSGAHSSKILDPLRKKGAKIASVHPIQTFPQNQTIANAVKSLTGIYYGIDAPRETLRDAKSLVKLLGGKPVVISDSLRPLYHALCVFSSGYIVQLLNLIEKISKQLDFPKPWHEILGPLMATSIANSIKISPASALTGPIMRGDVATIGLHIKALKKYAPKSVNIYKALGTSTARVAFAKRLINKTTYNAILKSLSV
jgi:predicted short-subunit dehydrogenase-like oxidoreductase (DUF2520 family)